MSSMNKCRFSTLVYTSESWAGVSVNHRGYWTSIKELKEVNRGMFAVLIEGLERKAMGGGDGGGH